MCPLTHASYLSLIVAAGASFIFGFLWYGPLFGKTWAGLVGIKFEEGKCNKPHASALVLTFVGTLFTVIAMAYIMNIYKPACLFGAGIVAWFGFYVPLLIGSVVWEGRPWNLFILNGVYYLLNLQLIALVLTYLK